ncbi:MAG: phosphoribosylanthranilate isomerase, partial [Mobilitalea sp.]
MTKIKICGLSRPIDIEMVNNVLPDYIGFVFAKSKRQVNDSTALLLKSNLDPKIQVVGVFVNEDSNRIVRLCQEGVIDVIQLHGDEGEGYIRQLKSSVSNPIIKAVRVQTAEDIRLAEELSCDYILLDTYKDNQYGGSGETFNWSIVPKGKKPFFLAGGINTENVLEAIESMNPYCIDVSSGVETDGYKDLD